MFHRVKSVTVERSHTRATQTADTARGYDPEQQAFTPTVRDIAMHTGSSQVLERFTDQRFCCAPRVATHSASCKAIAVRVRARLQTPLDVYYGG
jgi:hypothetical protein